MGLFKLINTIPFVQELMDKTTEIMFILNKDRQVVFTNKAFMDFVGISAIEDVLGKRPGEALSCVNSDKVSGCGTSEFCITCGAVNAILESQNNHTEAIQECLLSVRGGDSFELKVIAKPFYFNDEELTFFTAKDISESKRKRALEKIFFHDIMNLASGIYSVIDLFKDGTIDDLPDEMLGMLHRSSSDMLKEISDYRTLMLAERKELKAMPKLLCCDDIINEVVALYDKAGERRGVILRVADSSCRADMRTDPSLLKRVLINMVKNAMEASSNGDKVTVWCETVKDGVCFKVNNPAVLTEEVSTQIFRRTFTTKSSGSGLGTYSIKLLAEQYLGGSVIFHSAQGEGTTFEVYIPCNLK